MVPADYITYFATMAAVGGTLVGLIFIAVSIVPESTVQAKAPLERQTRVASAFTALLNPLIISLFALIPHNTIGYTALIVGSIDLLGNIIISIYLLQQKAHLLETLYKATFIIGAFVLYIYQLIEGIRLVLGPGDADALETLAVIMIVIYTFGISRAWDVLGARQFQFTDWVMDIIGNMSHKSRHGADKQYNDLVRTRMEE